jgi:hypothetical protein
MSGLRLQYPHTKVMSSLTVTKFVVSFCIQMYRSPLLVSLSAELRVAVVRYY